MRRADDEAERVSRPRVRPPTAGGLVLVLLLSLGVIAAPPKVAGALGPPAPPTFGQATCPQGTTSGGAVPPSTPVSLVVGFTHDEAGLEAFARSVSDPQSPTHGSYPSVADVAHRFGLSDGGRAAFEAGLAAVGATGTVDVTGVFGKATVTAAQAGQIFSTTMVACEVGSPATQVAVAAATDPVAPADWIGAVTVVQGLQQLPPGPPEPPQPPPPDPVYPFPIGPVNGGTAQRTGTAEGCADALAVNSHGVPQGFAPNQLRHAYGLDVAQAVGSGSSGARAAIVAINPPSLTDVAAFAACFGLPMPNVVVHQAPGSSTQTGTEPTLDVSALLAAAPEVSRIDVFVSAGDGPDVPTLAAPLDAASTGGQLPDVVSDSYGSCEQFVKLQPNALLMVPLRESVLAVGAAAGVGYYAAAGDAGSACLSDTSASAWATAVGGTNLTLATDNTFVSNGTWNDLAYCLGATPCPFGAQGGGGGASQLIARPWWQTGPGISSGTTRLVPDVAFVADAFPGILYNCLESGNGGCPGGWTNTNGTSFATPFFAGSMAALASRARGFGLPAPGFVSPALYELARSAQYPTIFHDVVLGTNDVSNSGCCTATPFHDTASGWGSVRIDALADALAPVPRPTPTTTAPGATSLPSAVPVAVPRFTG